MYKFKAIAGKPEFWIPVIGLLGYLTAEITGVQIDQEATLTFVMTIVAVYGGVAGTRVYGENKVKEKQIEEDAKTARMVRVAQIQAGRRD